MADATSPHLQLVGEDEEARRFEAMLEVMAGAPRRASASQTARPIAVEFRRLAALVKRLEERVKALEAELVPPHRGRKCPCCHRLSLVVVAAQPHPEFGAEGIEQHDVRCGCGYQASRLYDPGNFLR